MQDMMSGFLIKGKISPASRPVIGCHLALSRLAMDQPANASCSVP